jgi:hypothetical protein
LSLLVSSNEGEAAGISKVVAPSNGLEHSLDGSVMFEAIVSARVVSVHIVDLHRIDGIKKG